MIDAELLAILVCPETKQPLRKANADELAAAKMEQGFARKDGRVVYPIVAGIPMLLVENGVRITPASPV